MRRIYQNTAKLKPKFRYDRQCSLVFWRFKYKQNFLPVVSFCEHTKNNVHNNVSFNIVNFFLVFFCYIL